MAFDFNNNIPRQVMLNGANVVKIIYNNKLIWSKKRLPSEYQEVEYIVFDGKSYINTNFYTNQNSKVQCKIVGTESGRGIYASSNGSSRDDNFTAYFSFGGNQRFGNTTTIVNYTTNVEYTLIQDKNGFRQNGVLYPYSEVPDFTSESKLLLGRNGKDFIGNFYYMKIWDNNVLIRDLIPCYRKSDNEVGMYDIVNNVFYTNVGTGAFIAGPNVITS